MGQVRRNFLPFRNAYVLLICFPILISSGNSIRSSFGESCSIFQRCDRRAWLGCVNGTCDCLKPDEMFYDPGSGACVTKVGERCKYTLENFDGNVAYEMTVCAENSACGPDGYCSCIEDYVESPNGTCIPTRKYLEACETPQLRCSSLLGLECQDGVCQCNNATKFSLSQKQCVGLVGEVCIGLKCIDNARCGGYWTNTCLCQDGYFQDLNNDCSEKMGLLKECTHDEQCKDSLPLKCNNGLCTCDPEVALLQKGEQIRGEFPNAICVGKARSPCISERCTSGASCVEVWQTTHSQGTHNGRRLKRTPWWGTNDQTYDEDDPELTTQPHIKRFRHKATEPTLIANNKTCECQSGYTISKHKTCGKAYGSNCKKTECLEEFVCTDNKCSCRYPSQQVYSASTKSCRNKVRGPCSTNEDCIDNAVCSLFNDRPYGECLCKGGYIENSKRECDVQHGGDCQTNSNCDSMAGLICVEGRCDCQGFAKFHKTTRKCLGLVGGSCTCPERKGRSASVSCIEGSKCSCINTNPLEESYDQGTCVCHDGFHVSKDYACEVELEELEPVE